jgi:hypothetical protein
MTPSRPHILLRFSLKLKHLNLSPLKLLNLVLLEKLVMTVLLTESEYADEEYDPREPYLNRVFSTRHRDDILTVSWHEYSATFSDKARLAILRRIAEIQAPPGRTFVSDVPWGSAR